MNDDKLQKLIDEAKGEQPAAVRDLDWDKIEARVMSQVQAEDMSASHVRPVAAPGQTGLRSPEWRKKYLRPATVALAFAATVIIYARREAATAEHTEQHAGNQNSGAGLAQREEASSLTSGNLLIGGTPLAAGQVVRAGDALSVTNGRAVLERPKAVSWLIETDGPEAARARVSSAGASGQTAKPLVLDLEHGAIEAQVTPVKAGEAFAVDVITKTGIVRVAVHGTHLRVARAGDRVVVDLTEGVIAIGVPPAQGITTGTSIAAPAHIELDANDLGTMKVEHTNVRAPIQLGDHVVAWGDRLPTAPVTPHATVLAPTPQKTLAKPEEPRVAIAPRDQIINAVRACAVTHAKSNSEMKVSVTSSLELTVGADGMPTLAKFTPPLPAEVQTCAAETIYKTKLEETGTVSVPISFSY